MADPRLGHRLLMLGLIASPIVALAVLVYGIILSLERGPSMDAPPIGAGAGDAGGANALGQSLFGSGGPGIPAEQTALGAVLVVSDESGRATAENPILLVTSFTEWRVENAVPLRLDDDGLWRITAPRPPVGATAALSFRLMLGEEREIDVSGDFVGARALPRVPAESGGEAPLVYRFTVRGFSGE